MHGWEGIEWGVHVSSSGAMGGRLYWGHLCCGLLCCASSWLHKEPRQCCQRLPRGPYV